MAATVVGIAWLARDVTFWADAWVFIEARQDWDAAAFLGPHWEHPVLVQAVLWKTLMSTVGLSSHLPYLALNLVAHVLTAAALYRIVRRPAGDAVGFAAALLLLVLGSAGEVLAHSMSLNLVASAAAGVWALALFLEGPGRRGQVAVAVLLLVAALASGAGLIFAGVIGATLLLAPGRRRELWTVVPAGLFYVVYQLIWGSSTVGDGSLLELARLLPGYVQVGVAHAVGVITVLGPEVGLVLAVLLAVATGWHVLGRQPLMIGAVAGVIGLVLVYAVTGLARADRVEPGDRSPAESSRYVYFAAIFLLTAGGTWLSRRAPLPLRSARHVLPFVVLVGIAVVGNGIALVQWARMSSERSQEIRAAIAIIEEHAGSPALPLDRRLHGRAPDHLATLPTPVRLAAILDSVGSPLDPDPLGLARTDPPPEAREVALLHLVGADFQVRPTDPADPPPTGASPAAVREALDATVSTTGGCLTIAPTGPVPTVIVAVPGDGSLRLTPSVTGPLRAALSRDGTFPDLVGRSAELAAGRPVAIGVPDLDADWPWLVRLELPAGGPSEVCLTEATA
jgi:hypothetical protein